MSCMTIIYYSVTDCSTLHVEITENRYKNNIEYCEIAFVYSSFLQQ